MTTMDASDWERLRLGANDLLAAYIGDFPKVRPTEVTALDLIAYARDKAEALSRR